MSGIFRAVNFDLDTKKMKESLGSATKGYGILRKSFKEFGFSHRQGSGYRSDRPMTITDIDKFIEKFSKANPWLCECVKTFDVTSSGKMDYSFADTIRAAGAAAKANAAGVNARRLEPSFEEMARSIQMRPRQSSADNENALSNEIIND